VGHPHAVNPDRRLRKVAMARGWPVLAFAGPGGQAVPASDGVLAGQTCEQQVR